MGVFFVEFPLTPTRPATPQRSVTPPYSATPPRPHACLSLALLFYMRLSLALLLPRSRRASRWSSPPAPRRTRAPAASTPHAHEAVARFGRPFSGRSFFLLASHCATRHARPQCNLARGAHRSQVTLIEMNAFGSPTRMLVRHLHYTGEQRQVNEWLTGRLHEGGTRSVRSPLRRAPFLATPIATPLLQCGRPKRSDLLFLKLLSRESLSLFLCDRGHYDYDYHVEHAGTRE